MMHLFQMFCLWQQGLEQDHKTCVCAPATGSQEDVMDKTAQIHPARCNTHQKLSEHAQTHVLATSNLLRALKEKRKASEGWWLLFSPSQCSQAGYAPPNSRGQHEYIV